MCSPSRSRPPTFTALANAEPRLRVLLEEARAVRNTDDPHFCANSVWYGYGDWPGLKPRLVRLVGWERKGQPLLETMDAYDVAYRTIYDALPGCRDCICVRESSFR